MSEPRTCSARPARRPAMNNALLAPPVQEISAPRLKVAAPTQLVRVLHVVNGEHFSGAERVQDLLAGHLPTCGYELSFACVKPGRFPAARQHRDARLYELPMRSR